MPFLLLPMNWYPDLYFVTLRLNLEVSFAMLKERRNHMKISYSTSLKQATRKCDIQFLEKGKHNSN